MQVVHYASDCHPWSALASQVESGRISKGVLPSPISGISRIQQTERNALQKVAKKYDVESGNGMDFVPQCRRIIQYVQMMIRLIYYDLGIQILLICYVLSSSELQSCS